MVYGRLKRYLYRLKNHKYSSWIALALFVVLATVWLVHSQAASLVGSFETENGVLSGNTGIVTDASASGGSAVRFGSNAPNPTPTMTATLNAGTTFQTITALGVNINSDSWDNGNLKPALDLLVDNGFKTYRVVMEMADWEGTNDDTNASNFNWAYYNPIYSGATSFDNAQSGSNFANLWATIDYLHQKGVPDDNIMLSFMGPGPAWMGGTTVTSSKLDEWVEMVLSAAYYGYTNGHTFGLFSPNNEMDWGHNEGIIMSAANYADGLNRLAARMNTLGLAGVKIVGADTCCADDSYETAIKSYPTLMTKLGAFDFHQYGTSLGADPESGYVGTGKTWWVSEYSIFDNGFTFLQEGAPGIIMWDAYDAVYNHAILNGLGSSPPNDVGNAPPLISYNTTTKTYAPRKSFFHHAQLFKYTQLGMRRVQINSSNANMDLLAFVHPTTGAVTIVGQNNTGSAQVIGGTLAGVSGVNNFHVTYTNSGNNMASAADSPVSGNTFTASIPVGAIFTLTTL